jgi:hypothetical protein
LGDARWSLLAHSHAFADLTAKPTTLAGYGITDAYTNAQVDTLLAGKAATSHAHAAADVTSGVFAVARLGTGVPDGTKFLRDDGVFAVPAGGTGLIDGSGTAGKITKWLDSNTLTDSIISESSGGVTLNGGASPVFITLNANAGVVRDLRYATAGVNRWAIRTDLSVESGGNLGSNLVFNRRDDAGGDLGDVLLLNRTTGSALFAGNLQVNGTSEFRDTINIGATGEQGVISYSSDVGNGEAGMTIRGNAAKALGLGAGGSIRGWIAASGVLTWAANLNFSVDNLYGIGTSGNRPHNVDVGTEYRVVGTKVVGAQGALVANATASTTSNTTTINAVLARLRAHGLIAT